MAKRYDCCSPIAYTSRGEEKTFWQKVGSAWENERHFSKPLKHARHYIGMTTRGDVEARLDEHRKGKGARICKAAVANGATLAHAHSQGNDNG